MSQQNFSNNTNSNSKTSVIISLIVLLLILASLFFWLYSATTQKTNSPEQLPNKPTTAQNNKQPQKPNSDTPLCAGGQSSAPVIDYDSSLVTKLKIEDTQIGSGGTVKSGDTVCIHYRGTLENGTEFDTSYKRNKPFVTQIGVGSVIKGWDLGIVGLKEGGKRKLTIPAQLGYGSQSTGSIPANSTLIFEVELVKILNTK